MIMNLKTIFCKINKKLVKLRLQPIHVFVFHQVSDVYDETTMHECDWTQTEKFKTNIQKLKLQYEFISLVDAMSHIKHDFFRRKKYVVLTSDDGWLSLKNILPWLEQEKIHITLFVNPGYFDGKHYRENATEKYLSFGDINSLNPEYISIGMHGWEHTDATLQTMNEFQESILMSEKLLCRLNSFIPYFCFTWGKHNADNIDILKKKGIVPVLTDGGENFNDAQCVHREVIDGIIF